MGIRRSIDGLLGALAHADATPAYLGVSFNNLVVGGVLGPILAVPLSVKT
jgi:hypothetical protein